MKRSRMLIHNIGSLKTHGRFAVIHYARRVHTEDKPFFDKWTNGPNTYYRAGSFAWRVRKEKTCDDR